MVCNPRRRNKERDLLLQTKYEGGKHRGFVSLSLRNINQLTVTRLMGELTGEGTCQTKRCVLTELGLGIDPWNMDALLPAGGVMGSAIVQFVISFQTS